MLIAAQCPAHKRVWQGGPVCAMVLQVDRKKLRSDAGYAPDWAAAAGPSANEEFAEPESELERRLQVVWQEVLAQDAIGVTSDFFHLGGTSLRVPPTADRLHGCCFIALGPIMRPALGHSPRAQGMGKRRLKIRRRHRTLCQLPSKMLSRHSILLDLHMPSLHQAEDEQHSEALSAGLS